MLQSVLKVVGGKHEGKTIPLMKKFIVGREEDCHLRPNSDLVSRHHCVFTMDDYTLRLRDLGSTTEPLLMMNGFVDKLCLNLVTAFALALWNLK